MPSATTKADSRVAPALLESWFSLAGDPPDDPIIFHDLGPLPDFAHWWPRSYLERYPDDLRSGEIGIGNWLCDRPGERQFAYALAHFYQPGRDALWAEALLQELRRRMPPHWRASAESRSVWSAGVDSVFSALHRAGLRDGDGGGWPYNYNAYVLPHSDRPFDLFRAPESLRQLGEIFSVVVNLIDRDYQVVASSKRLRRRNEDTAASNSPTDTSMRK